MRRYPRIRIGPAALPLFCLAPHGVFHASRITPRAVSSYLAFSPLPALCCQRTGGVFSVTLSVTAIFSTATPACFTRHAAVWCSDFPLSESFRLASDHLPSANNLSQQDEEENSERAAPKTRRILQSAKEFQSGDGTRQKENRDHYERDK